MSNTLAFGKKAFTIAVVGATIVWAVGFSALVPLTASAASAGDLIKGSLPAVYYYGSDGKRYVFPNERTYKTWYSDFSSVKTISDAELANIAIGGNVTYKTGLIKITSANTVYEVSKGGKLHAIPDEATAKAMYGADWAKQVHDVPDAFFTNYTVGSAVAAGTTAKTADVASDISSDKSLAAAPTTPAVAGAVTLSLAATTPASASAPYLAGDVIFAQVTVAGKGDLTGVKVTRTGLSADADLSLVKLFDGTTQLGISQTLDANHQAVFVLSTPWKVDGTKTLTIAGNINGNAAGQATAGNLVVLGISAASDVTLSAGTVGGTFPIRGNAMTVATTSIGTLTVENGASTRNTNTNVDPGNTTPIDILGGVLTAGATEDIEVTRIAAVKDGTHVSTDIKSIQLYDVTNSKVLATVSGWNSDFKAVFDLSASPLKITKGNSVSFQVRVEALQGSGRTVDAYLKKNGRVFEDISARGTTYNLGIVARDDGSGTAWDGRTRANNDLTTSAEVVVTIASGSLTILRSASSPATGNIAAGAQNEGMLKIDVQVKGEDMRSSSLVFTGVTGTTMASSSVTGCVLRNKDGVAVAGPVDPSGTTPIAADTLTFSTAITFPVGTNTYSLHCNIATGATGTVAFQYTSVTLTGASSGNSVTATGAATGSTLTVQAGALTIVNRAAPATENVVGGATKVTLAETILDASASGEDVRVTQMIYTDALADTTSALTGDANIGEWSNVRLTKEDGTTLLADIQQPSDGTDGANTSLTFTLSTPLIITKKTSTIVKLLGDLETSGITALDQHRWRVNATTGVTAAGVTTGGDTTLTLSPATANGSGKTLTVRGNGTLTASLDASSPVAGVVVDGSNGVIATVIKLVGANETSRVETVTLSLGGSSASADIKQVYLYDGDTELAKGYFTASTTPTVTFDIASKDFQVKDQETRRLTAKIDVNTVLAGATSGNQIAVNLAATTDLVAKGLSSAGTVNASAAVTGNTMRVRNTIPKFAKDVSSPTVLIPGLQDAFIFNITADAGGDVVFKDGATAGTYIALEGLLRMQITKSGTLTGTSATLIWKQKNGTRTNLSTLTVGNTTTNLVFNFELAGAGNFVIGAGQTETLIVSFDTSGLTSAGNSIQLTIGSDSSATNTADGTLNTPTTADGSNDYDSVRWNDDRTNTDYNGFGLPSLPISGTLVKS